MLDEKVDEILAKIRSLEEDLIEELKKKEDEFFYKIENNTIKFQDHIIKEGKSKIIGPIKYLYSFRLSALLTIPFIWLLIIPTFVVDILVTVYQYICFPVYKIPKVKRKDYIIMDRHKLFYLGIFEWINCWYCEYFNGVISYIKEIAGRTEQFWCPIKHAKTPKDMHSRYYKFFDYGDYIKYRQEWEKRREDFADLEEKQ